MKPITSRYMRLNKYAIAAIAALSSFSSFAEGPYTGIEAGGNHLREQNIGGTGGKFESKNGFVGGLVGGYSFDNGWRPEVEVDFRTNDLRSLRFRNSSTAASGRERAVTGMANLWYDLPASKGLFSKFRPYIGGGLGYAEVQLKDVNVGGTPLGSDTKDLFAYQAGAGVGFAVTRNLTASLDYRYLKTTEEDFTLGGVQADGEYFAQSLMAGLRYTFHQPKAAPLAVPVAAMEPAPVAAAPAPVVAPAPVEPQLDSDGDGVFDQNDKCPNTPRGFAVDTSGCIIKQSVVIRAVNFVFDRAELTGAAKETLNDVAAAIVGQPDLTLEIIGHTDSKGSDAYNRKLSLERAQSVRSYLISKGANGSNLTAIGKGEDSPVADNKTEAGRTENRRVEFNVTNAPANLKVKTEESTDDSKAAASKKR